jgi:hypothetical protein
MTVAAGNIRRGILPLGNAILFGVTVGKWVGLMIQTFVDKNDWPAQWRFQRS